MILVMKKRRATPKSRITWLTIIKEYLTSGISKEKFCKDRQLNILSFKSWHSHFNPKNNPLSSKKVEQLNFIPVKVMPQANRSPTFGLNIELPNGIKLAITDVSVDSHKLQELLKVCCNVVNGQFKNLAL